MSGGGIYSHFANADTAVLHSAQTQLDRFNQVLSFYEQRGLPPPPLRHMANSEPFQLPGSHLSMVRDFALRGLPVGRGGQNGDRTSSTQLEVAGGLLQGGAAGSSGELRLHLAKRPHGAGGHRARGLWRRLFSAHVGAGAGDHSGEKVSGNRPYLYGSAHGQH
ncbi:MAG: alanine racemase [Ardenticatenaceae bacterium]|nr:alanine racemase [Ardenticatenaceae bacterium]